MKKSKLPKTDSIQQLAKFWDTHDLTDFEDELEEVAEPAFVRGSAIKVHLDSPEAEAVQQMAQAKGVSQEELIHAWVLEKLSRRTHARRTKRCRCNDECQAPVSVMTDCWTVVDDAPVRTGGARPFDHTSALHRA